MKAEEYSLIIIFYTIKVVGFLVILASLLFSSEMLITYIVKQLKIYPLLYQFTCDYYKKKSKQLKEK